MVCHVLLKWIIMWLLLRRNDLEESTSRDQSSFEDFSTKEKRLKMVSDNSTTNEDIFVT